MRQRKFHSFSEIKHASLGGTVKQFRANGGRTHIVVVGNPDVLNEAYGGDQHGGVRNGTKIQRSPPKTDGKNIASPS
jgi:hypothetical protein